MCASDNHADKLHGGKKGRSVNSTGKQTKSLATPTAIKRSNNQRSPQQDINPKKKVNKDMNTETSITDTIEEEVSIKKIGTR